MKLRFHRNSLRLRLTPAEVAQLQETGQVQTTTPFPTAALTCRLQTTAAPKSINATLEANTIQITVPQQDAHRWATTEQEISLESEIPINTDTTLHILIEKDFQCLHGKDHDTNEIFYPNPALRQSSRTVEH